jgi:hypothetical protein
MPQARLEPVPSSCLFDIGLAAFVAGFASDGRVSFRSRQRAGHGEGGAVDAVIRGAVGASLGALGKRRPRRPCTLAAFMARRGNPAVWRRFLNIRTRPRL